MRHCKYRNLNGYSIVELLAVLGIVSILVAIALPAIHSVRESARRTTCNDRMRNISLAVLAFHETHGYLPSRKKNESGQWMPVSFLIEILPQLGHQNVYDQLSWAPWPTNEQENRDLLLAFDNSIFRCPSDRADASDPDLARFASIIAPTNFVGNLGRWYFLERRYDGLFGQQMNRNIKMSEITDGLSTTALVSECLIAEREVDCRRIIVKGADTTVSLEQFMQVARQQCADFRATGDFDEVFLNRGLEWHNATDFFTGYHHIFQPNGLNSLHHGATLGGAFSAASEHPGGVNVSFCDGHLDYVKNEIDPTVWHALGSRDGRETVPGF